MAGPGVCHRPGQLWGTVSAVGLLLLAQLVICAMLQKVPNVVLICPCCTHTMLIGGVANRCFQISHLSSSPSSLTHVLSCVAV